MSRLGDFESVQFQTTTIEIAFSIILRYFTDNFVNYAQ